MWVVGGYVVGGGFNDIWFIGIYVFIVGDIGYVYGFDDVIGVVIVLDAGVAIGQNLNVVYVLISEFVVVVGNNGVVIYIQNGVMW